jgi:IS5 family transposase
LHYSPFLILSIARIEEALMAQKQVGRPSFAEALLPQGVGRNERLERAAAQLKWYRFEKILCGLCNDGPGPSSYPSLVMFRSLLLQSWYGLSDAGLEEALADRLSFRRFVGLSLEDPTPDHTTVCRFRNRLIEARLLERLFAELDRQFEKQGLILKRGTMLDATVIEAANARPPRGESGCDPDASFAKKEGAGWTYGYKAHVGVDEGSGLIRAIRTTPNNVNETTVADDLIRGDERAVFGDRAYDSHARREALRARGVKNRIMRRGNKHHPLPTRLRRLNKLLARRRAAVETTFATLKRRMGLRRARYRGLVKTAGQMLLAAMAFNLRRATLIPG